MNKHSDCLNFAPIDAAKGICRIINDFVNIDEETCSQFRQAPKCGNCKHFKDRNEEEIGKCTGLEKEAWSFAELKAVTCEGYAPCE